MAVHNVTAFNRLADTIDVLESHRLVQNDFASVQAQQQVAVIINAQAVDSFKSQLDLSRIRARTYDEVVFQLSFVPVVDQVRSRINARVFHGGITGDAGVPIQRI